MFHEYLLRGGFPQTAQIDNLATAQRLMREDIVDKVMKRDMTALFGVRRVLELEQVFLYLCLHDGGILEMTNLCSSLELKRPTVSNFIDLLEATHLIHRLLPFGYGRQVLRGRPKIYLADPAIAPSVMLKGRGLLEDSDALARTVETAFFKHVFTRYYAQSIRFSYWQGRKDREVDLIAEFQGLRTIPFEVKYRSGRHTRQNELKGMIEFCAEKKIDQGYVITREVDDFSHVQVSPTTRLLKIPAALACFWLGQSELSAPS